MKKKKSFCDLSKEEVKEKLDELILLTNNPKFICRKCARVGNTEIHLCKPIEINK